MRPGRRRMGHRIVPLAWGVQRSRRGGRSGCGLRRPDETRRAGRRQKQPHCVGGTLRQPIRDSNAAGGTNTLTSPAGRSRWRANCPAKPLVAMAWVQSQSVRQFSG
jgi:hypothetical protein